MAAATASLRCEAHQFAGPLAFCGPVEDDEIAGFNYGRQLRIDPALGAPAVQQRKEPRPTILSE